MQGIVDAHIHMSRRKNDLLRKYAETNRLEYTPDGLLQVMEANGITRGLLLSSVSRSGTPFPCEDAVEISRLSGGRLLPVLTVAPSSKGASEAVQLAKRIDAGVRGFKVMLGYGGARASDKVFDPVFEYAESAGLPVLFHTGDTADARGNLADSHPIRLDEVANRRRDMTIVACHFGNPWIDDVAELIYKHPNVYADVSGMTVGGSKYGERYLERLADRLSGAIYYAGGADKVMFGSDYPVTHPATAITLVKSLAIDEKDKRRILSENAKKVFDI